MQSTAYDIFVEEGGKKIQGHGPLGFATVDWTGETLAGMGLLRSNVKYDGVHASPDLPGDAGQDCITKGTALILDTPPPLERSKARQRRVWLARLRKTNDTGGTTG